MDAIGQEGQKSIHLEDRRTRDHSKANVVNNITDSETTGVPTAPGEEAQKNDPVATSRSRWRPRHVETFTQIILVGVDSLMLALAFVLGYYARATLPFPEAPVDDPPGISEYIPMLVVHTAAIVIFFYFSRMYHMSRTVNRFDTALIIAQNVSIGTFLAVAIETMAFKNSGFDLDYPRGVIVYAWVFSILLVMIGREAHRSLVYGLRRSGIGRDQILIIGTGPTAAAISTQIRRHTRLGYDIVGLVNQSDTKNKEAASSDISLPILGTYEQLPTVIDDYEITQVIIALPEATRDELLTIVTLCQRGTVDIKIFPDTFAFITSGLTVDELGGMPLLGVRDIALRGWKLSLKRGVDIVGASIGLIFLSPLMLLISLLIYLTNRGPVFFCQERVGLDGKPFPMIKFRTMVVDAEKKSRWTVKNDTRVTRIGSFLRKTNIDELPNLINVFYGQMSLVGPRPEQKSFVEEFRQKIPRYMERHREKAGMTGWAQINGLRGDTSIEERLKYDLYYIENWSLWFDIKIILRTIVQTLLFRNRNAY